MNDGSDKTPYDIFYEELISQSDGALLMQGIGAVIRLLQETQGHIINPQIKALADVLIAKAIKREVFQ